MLQERIKHLMSEKALLESRKFLQCHALRRTQHKASWPAYPAQPYDNFVKLGKAYRYPRYVIYVSLLMGLERIWLWNCQLLSRTGPGSHFSLWLRFYCSSSSAHRLNLLWLSSKAYSTFNLFYLILIGSFQAYWYCT